MIHKRVSKETSFHILEKPQSRLAGWKAEQLTMAGRTLLVKSVTSSLPIYTMQTAKIPESINQEIDKCNSRFIWGSTEAKKKIHLIAWDNLCKPKENGGLGLRSMSKSNISFMAKMGWKLLTEPESLWASVLRGKFIQQTHFFDSQSSPQASYTWKSIQKGKELLKKGTRWAIGDGKQTKFWTDLWVGDEPLIRLVASHISESDKLKSVWDYTDGRGNWLWEDFAHLLPHLVILHIRAIKLSMDETNPNTMIWRGSTNGRFNTKSAYAYFEEQVPNREEETRTRCPVAGE